MRVAAWILVLLIAIEHLWFMVLEMFLFTSPTGLETFGITQQFANEAATLAANQGLYNGFLAAGLLRGLVTKNHDASFELKIFFLGCVFIAGAYGGYTIKPSVFLLQGLPALFALALICIDRRRTRTEV